jgi:Ala-tRNA(Pro) deacylase
VSISAKLQGYLDEHRVRYHVLKHHETYTAREIAEALHVPGKELAKVVMVRTNGKFLMAVLPSNHMIHLKTLAQAAGVEHAILAEETEFAGLFPDCEVGAMPPFGNLYNVPVYVDQSLTQDEEIVFEAGTHREAIKMAFRDYQRLVQPKVVNFGRRV